MQIFMVLFAAATTMPDSLFQQYDDSAYSPVIISSLVGNDVVSPGILKAAMILRSKRQDGVGKSERTMTEYIVPQTVTEVRTL